MDSVEIPQITVQELESLQNSDMEFLLIDVRNPEEFVEGNLGGKLIPLSELPSRIGDLDPDQYTIVHCHAGGRSSKAVGFLIDQGFTNVFNLKGGMSTWLNEIGPGQKG